ncbi:MAG: F0F1 ATP synthase subunit B [Cyanobacteria bacterium P01_D01_bin.50]
MGTFLILVAEASAVGSELVEEAAGNEGFALNTNVLDTNLVNLAIIIVVLLVFGRKVLGSTLLERREKIEASIKNAEKRAQDAASALADQQQKLAQAQAEAERIKQAAQENAGKAKEAILAQAAVDVERMKQTAAADLDTEREKAISQLRQRVVAQALEKVESQLRGGIADDAQHTLVDRSLAQLGS